MKTSSFILLAVCLSLAAACNTDDDAAYNKCPFVSCYSDYECASGECDWYNNHGICRLEDWHIAVISIVGVLILIAFISCCVCCCRRRRL